jgi:hypothetical protein
VERGRAGSGHCGPSHGTARHCLSELRKKFEEALDAPSLFQIFNEDGLASTPW